MHLGEDRDLAVGEALDDVHLPERTRPVQRDAGEVAGHLGQLAVAAGRRHGHAVHVPVDVELVVGDPDREVDATRNRLELAVEHRDALDPVGELLLERLEVIAAGDGRWIDGDDPAHVHELRAALEVEEAGIQSAESIHGRILDLLEPVLPCQ